MDYRHHHLVSHHRNIVIEAASQRLGGCRHDESEEGHDVRNPYMTGLDLSVGEELSRSFEPCLKLIIGPDGSSKIQLKKLNPIIAPLRVNCGSCLSALPPEMGTQDEVVHESQGHGIRRDHG